MTIRIEIMRPRADVGVTAGADARPAMLNEPTFRALYARTAAPLHAYVSRTLGDSSAADDIVQEAFLRLLRRAVPTTDLDELRRYLFRIASNLIVDRWRATRRETTSAAPERAAQSRDAVTRIDMARLFGRLTLRDRKLIWLAHVEGADHREIASMLGLRTGSIRVLLSRARRRLAQLLRDAGHGAEGRR
jgi:RNA polymerase sigma-70 factor (ECF subfamily)